jgi:hypothetical protein
MKLWSPQFYAASPGGKPYFWDGENLYAGFWEDSTTDLNLISSRLTSINDGRCDSLGT